MFSRSNSASHIPIAKNETRARSKSSIRMSGKEPSNWGVKSNVKRGSTDKIPTLKRSTSSTTLKKSLLTTPTVPGPSFKRSLSNLQTPSSSRKSPYRHSPGKSDRNIGDKKWVFEQYTKVRNYLQEHATCHDHTQDIKPPSIKTFVHIMELLLKEIDGRITLTMANYKEVLMNRLKMLRYPGNISNSLLKTVNTMHAWPQVICIFAWLVDLIEIIKRAELPVEPVFESDMIRLKVECVSDYIIEKYKLYNNGEDKSLADAAFAENYARILTFDEKEIEKLNKEVAKLSSLKEKQMEQIRDIQHKNDLLKKEIDQIEYQIDTFYVEDEEKQDDIDQTIEYLRQKKIRLMTEIKEKQEHIKKLNEAIAKQPCSYEEKIRLETHIDQLIHTLDLKKQRLATKRELKANCDTKLVEAMKKVETEVYRLNNELMQLAMVEPELKVLQLRESDFLSEGFRNEIKAVVENKKMFEKKICDQIEIIKTSIFQCTSENEKIENELEAKKKEIQELTKMEYKTDENIKKYENQIQNLKSERENQKQLILEKIRKLDDEMPDVASLRLKLTQLKELQTKKVSDLDILIKNTEDSFSKLYEEVMGNLEQMNEQRTRVFCLMTEKLNQVVVEEENIYNELQQLSSINVKSKQ